MEKQVADRIAAARSEVHKSELEPEHKDNLQAFLDHAERCANGTPDKIGAIGAAVADMVIRDARREVREESRVTRAIQVHVETCPRNVPGPSESSVPSGKLGTFITVAKHLTPWRWPLALAACSPFTADLVAQVGRLFTH